MIVPVPDFSSYSLPVNALAFVIGAVTIWLAGTRLERCVDGIAERTGLGKAFLGLLLLATATSLPELATTVSACLAGNTDLAVHNLLGGVVMQTAVLAVADLAMGRRALSYVAPQFALLLQATGLVLLLSVILAGMPILARISDGQPAYLRLAVAAWCAAIVASFVFMFHQAYHGQGTPKWHPRDKPDDQGGEPGQEAADRQALRALVMRFVLASLWVMLAGFAVARSGEAIAEQTGLGSSFVGFTLVAVATSLPEISTSVTAVRRNHAETAFSNIFGSNAFDSALLVVVATIAGGTSLVESLTPSTQFAAGLGIFLTCIYLWGLLERRDRTIGRLGWDSAAVVLFAALGNGVVFWLR
jgi:cation:H+ antiporter